jgi:hypothetical protein
MWQTGSRACKRRWRVFPYVEFRALSPTAYQGRTLISDGRELSTPFRGTGDTSVSSPFGHAATSPQQIRPDGHGAGITNKPTSTMWQWALSTWWLGGSLVSNHSPRCSIVLSIAICKGQTCQKRSNHATLLQLRKAVCLARGSQYPGSWTRPMIMVIVYLSQAVVASTITRHPLIRQESFVLGWWW